MPRTINLIVVHCSATQNGDGLFRGKHGEPGFKTPLDVIDEMHAARGFKRSGYTAKTFNPRHKSVGYHYIISCNGALFTGRHLGEPGAHVAGHNANSIGICLTGTSQYTAEQFWHLAALLRDLNKSTGIPLVSPKRVPTGLVGGVCGHRDLSPDLNGDGVVQSREWIKACPGFDVAGYLAAGLVPPDTALLKEV
jgi:N-acetylmuramoyl-L-alanine amidase